MVQINFFSLEAALWKILIIAQMSPASIHTPEAVVSELHHFLFLPSNGKRGNGFPPCILQDGRFRPAS
jgi:hypothetical protein